MDKGCARCAQDEPDIYKMNTKREQRKLAAIEQQIDENLRRVYQEDTTKEVPDRFMALLQQLREQE